MIIHLDTDEEKIFEGLKTIHFGKEIIMEIKINLLYYYNLNKSINEGFIDEQKTDN